MQSFDAAAVGLSMLINVSALRCNPTFFFFFIAYRMNVPFLSPFPVECKSSTLRVFPIPACGIARQSAFGSETVGFLFVSGGGNVKGSDPMSLFRRCAPCPRCRVWTSTRRFPFPRLVIIEKAVRRIVPGDDQHGHAFCSTRLILLPPSLGGCRRGG